MNSDKTQFLCFHITAKTRPPDDVISPKIHSSLYEENLSCTCLSIDRCIKIKYLEMKLDQNLNWVVHVENLVRIRKLDNFFTSYNKNTQCCHLTFYGQFILPYVSHCFHTASCFGKFSKTTLLRLERAQRSALKVTKISVIAPIT